MQFLVIIGAVTAIFQNIVFVIKYMQGSLGSDWYKKGEQITNAVNALSAAQTQEDKDAALKMVVSSFNS